MASTVLISLVVAMTRNRVIGRNNSLPWHLPADLRHFKAVTLGKPILMGRRTFESIGKPLPGRTNLVLTRHSGWSAAGVVVAHSVADALEQADAIARAGDAGELAVIGGAEVFSLLLPYAGRLYLTRIEADIAGDTLFPPVDLSSWVQRDSRRHCADERNAYDMTFMTLERAAPAAH